MPPSRTAIAVDLMARLGYTPDPWQIEVLENEHPRLLLNCCRQAGKSTIVAFLGLFEAMTKAMARVLLVSRTHRQSRELFRNVKWFHQLLGERALERHRRAARGGVQSQARAQCAAAGDCRGDGKAGKRPAACRRRLLPESAGRGGPVPLSATRQRWFRDPPTERGLMWRS
jgi:hypothetical protein